jgi:hypothetical protein
MSEEKFKKDDIIEIVTNNGITYVGMFKNYVYDHVTEEHVQIECEDVMKVNLTPQPTEDGKGFMLIPKIDVMNFYSNGSFYKFNISEIIYNEKIEYNKFQEYYKRHVDEIKRMKVEAGSNIEIVSNVPSNIKPIK